MGILGYNRKPLTPAQVDAFAEAGRKAREAAAKSPDHLGQSLGLPRAAVEHILKMEARLAQLERKVAALEGPAHLSKVEKR